MLTHPLRHGFLLVGTILAYAMSAGTAVAQTTPYDAAAAELAPVVTQAKESPELHIFHSPSCPHCRKEMAFLDGIEGKYPWLRIERHNADDNENAPLMVAFARGYGAERALGSVPLTFVGDKYFVGYDNDAGIGAEIESVIQSMAPEANPAPTDADAPNDASLTDASTLRLPVIGSIDPASFSLPVLAILLGFLDGFNVCSLGALVLIIGLSLKLQRRRAIVIFGGTYIVITSVVYGALIVLWYQVFGLFTAYLSTLKILVSLLALSGGAYFMKEYLRMRKQGAVCTMSESPLIARLMERTGKAFEDTTKLLTIVGSILVFAAVVTIVEFPCSAAVPVVFAGLLAQSGMGTVGYLVHIGLFTVFYMLDELIVFGIAAYKLKLWMTNGTFTKWAVLAEALILILIGAWYLVATVGIV